MPVGDAAVRRLDSPLGCLAAAASTLQQVGARVTCGIHPHTGCLAWLEVPHQRRMALLTLRLRGRDGHRLLVVTKRANGLWTKITTFESALLLASGM